MFEAILSRIGGDRPGEIPVPSPSSTSISHGGSLKVPPFRKLEPEEDVDSYFGAFEAHMEFHDVPNGQWSKYLGPILNPDANLVYMAMDTTARKQYSTLKEALYQHYRISQETYRAKMVQVRRKAGESWTTCGNRYLNFCWKWVKDCSTLGDMVELSSIDAVTKLMPKPISNHVRDHAPTTLKEATKLADEFMLTRGWSLDQISDREVPDRDNGKRHHRREEHQRPKKDRNYQQEELESPRSKSTDVSNGKSNGNWKKQPKFDPFRGPRCFSCNEYGHDSSECPTKKERKNLPRLEDLNLAVTLTARDEADLVESEIVRKVIIPGKVAGQDVSQILLDTGADRTMVKSCLVPETAKTGEVVLMESYTARWSHTPWLRWS